MVIPIDKPAGMTSHTVVNILRRNYGIRRIGHAGTLDPFATGVLVLLVGRESTKLSSEYMGQDKEYRVKLKLGYESDSYDKDGIISEINTNTVPSRDNLEYVVRQYRGNISQIPPMYSAIKIGGKKLYELARQGKTIERPPRQVYIAEIEIESYDYPWVVLRVVCGSGTYIRSLVRDIGNDLGVGAYAEELCRTRSGTFRVEECLSLDALPAYIPNSEVK